ncbi:phytanoyl-CoA dioxygenase family protein [Paenibacillus chitinolyticus]|uniref:phytanoyl-CoA dioxygenase family protein n=1 Tax=Paenibacillus chitinolyticus TaxID=79263 RepID=UPI003647C279
MSGEKLDISYELKREDVENYRANGHVGLRRILPPDTISRFRQVIAGAVEQRVSRGEIWPERDDRGRKESLTVMDLRNFSRDVYEFVTARRFAKAAAELMGVSRVRVLGDFAVFKQAGDKHTRWHQDNNHIVIDTDRTVTMWMPLTEVTETMGTMTFISGSQRLTDRAKGDAANLRTATRLKLPMFSTGPMNPGDVTFHAGNTLHMAGENRSGTTREVLTIMYFEDGARFIDPEELPGFEQSKHRVHAMNGYSRGDLAAGEDFPLVYDADRDGEEKP